MKFLHWSGVCVGNGKIWWEKGNSFERVQWNNLPKLDRFLANTEPLFLPLPNLKRQSRFRTLTHRLPIPAKVWTSAHCPSSEVKWNFSVSIEKRIYEKCLKCMWRIISVILTSVLECNHLTNSSASSYLQVSFQKKKKKKIKVLWKVGSDETCAHSEEIYDNSQNSSRLRL